MAELKEALQYASYGFKIFPCSYKTKAPLIENNLNLATDDKQQITAWWKQFKNPEIGLPTGRINKIGVIDLDVKEYTLEEVIQSIKDKFGFIINSPVIAITPSGGRHYYFNYTQGTKLKTTVKFKGLIGVDIRGIGGYVVAPPSNNINGTYNWLNGSLFDTELIEVPKEFFKKTLKGLRRLSTKRIKLDKTDIDLDNLEQIPDGTRDETLTSIAGKLRANGLDFEDILDRLSDINKEYCSPPLPEKQISKIAKSVCKYPAYKTNDTTPKEANKFIAEFMQLPRTDRGYAEMVAMYFQDEILFNHSLQNWLIWNGIHWETDLRRRIDYYFLEVADFYEKQCFKIEDDTSRETALKYAKKLQMRSKITPAQELLKSFPDIAIIEPEMNDNPHILGVNNGVVELKTGEFREGNAEDLISIFTSVNYELDATCPRWIQFLDEIFNGDKELIEFIQRSVGYSLTGLTKEQVLFFLVGSGANGKSVFLNIIHKLLGGYSYTTPFNTFVAKPVSANQNTFDLASLVNKRFVVSSETSINSRIDESRIKSLTGGEPIAARQIYGKEFNFVPSCKLWFAVNHHPKVSDSSPSFWRRILKIRFRNQFIGKNADTDLENKLIKELPGILNWSIEGANKWYQSGLMIPDSVKEATNEYRDSQDVNREFFIDVLVEEEGSFLAQSSAFNSYNTWFRSKNFPFSSKLSVSDFFDRLYQNKEKIESEGIIGVMDYTIDKTKLQKTINQGNVLGSSVRRIVRK